MSFLQKLVGYLACGWNVILTSWQSHCTSPIFHTLGPIVLFTSNSKNIFKRLIAGLFGLVGISQTLLTSCYLRLFALGLSGAVMASVFNNIGTANSTIYTRIVGYILMIFVVFSGHTINLGLSIMSGGSMATSQFLEFYRYLF